MKQKGTETFKESKSLKPGDAVKVKGTKFEARIERMMGSDVVLDRPVRGFRYYHTQELVKVHK